MAHAGGRPTKYNVSKVQELDDYMDSCVLNNDFPTIEQFAYLNKVDTDTITSWGHKHEKFLGAIKRLKTIQCHILESGIFKNTGNVAGGIFLLKNNHGFKDKTEQDVTSGGKPIPLLGGMTRVHTDDSNREDTPAK